MTSGHPPLESNDQALMDAYLLDRLDAADRTAVEDRVFADETFAAAMLNREHDLVDALAAGTLAVDDARALAARMGATPDGEARVRFARAWQAWQRAHPAASASGGPTAAPIATTTATTRWWAGGAAAAMAAALAWLAVDDVRLRERIRDQASSTPAAPARVEPAPSADGAAVRVVLSATRTRGGDAVAVVEVPANAGAVHLVLPDIGGTARLDARLESSPGGELVAQFHDVGAGPQGTLDIWLDARHLRDGAYEVLVSAADSPASPLLAQYALLVRRAAATAP